MKNYLNYKFFIKSDEHLGKSSVLCCPPLSPQMTGTGLAAPDTVNVSWVHTCCCESGCASVNVLKFNLFQVKSMEIYLLKIRNLCWWLPQLTNIWTAFVDCEGTVSVLCVVRVESARIDEERRVAVDDTAASFELEAAHAKSGCARAGSRSGTLDAFGHGVARSGHVGHLTGAHGVGEAHNCKNR